MAAVLPETYEFVEDGLMTDDNFRDFACDNPIRFWGESNPDFFKGTVVEDAAAAVLARSSAGARVDVNGHDAARVGK